MPMMQTYSVTCTECQKEYHYPAAMRAATSFACPHCYQEHHRDDAGNWQNSDKKQSNNSEFWAAQPGIYGILDGKEVMLVGVTEVVDTIYHNIWHEYLLVAEDGTRYFLNETDGHWIVMTDYDMKNSKDYHAQEFQIYNVADEAPFERIFDYTSSIRTFAGVLDYDVHTNSFCCDFIRPPEVFIRENRNDEISFFRGRHISKKELKVAFNGQLLFQPSRGVGMAQVFWIDLSNFYRTLGVFAGLILLLFLVGSISNRSEVVYESSLMMPDTLVRNPLVSPAFDLNGSTSDLTFTMTANQLNNVWFADEITLINDVTQAERTISMEASYYSGTDSDGYWVEDEHQVNAVLCGVDPGRYHLEITPIRSEMDHNEHMVTLKTTWQKTHSSNFFMAIGILALAALIVFIASYSFEASRWTHSPYSKYKSDES
jgi:hypothetical protein